MKTRTLWAALLAGEPGVIFGVSVLAFVVVLTAVLVFGDLAPRRVAVSDAGRPTVWQLQRQYPQIREEWLRQRVEAYRATVRARAAGAAHQETVDLTDLDTHLVALVADDDWPSQSDLRAAEDASSAVVRPASGFSYAASQAWVPQPTAPHAANRGQLRALARSEPRPLVYARRQIAA